MKRLDRLDIVTGDRPRTKRFLDEVSGNVAVTIRHAAVNIHGRYGGWFGHMVDVQVHKVPATRGVLTYRDWPDVLFTVQKDALVAKEQARLMLGVLATTPVGNISSNTKRVERLPSDSLYSRLRGFGAEVYCVPIENVVTGADDPVAAMGLTGLPTDPDAFEVDQDLSGSTRYTLTRPAAEVLAGRYRSTVPTIRVFADRKSVV